MFRKWLSENKVKDFDFSGTLFEKASNREFWDSKYKKEYIEDAERFLGFEWPLLRASDYMAFYKENNRMKYETPHFAKRDALITLFIGEILEHKGRFIPDIVDGVFNICEESFWGISAHYPPFHDDRLLPEVRKHYIDLFAGETASLLALISYILYDELYEYCPPILERVEYELDERIVKTYLNNDDFFWMGNYGRVNNWTPWIISNMLTVFLLTVQSKVTLDKGVEKMLYEINNIYTTYPDDGGCDEGISAYWPVSGGTLFEFCDLLYTATNGKINFFADQKIKNIGDHPYKAYIGNNYFVNFADGGSQCVPSTKSIFYRFGKNTGNKNLSALGKESLVIEDSISLASFKNYTKRLLFNVIYDNELSSGSDIKLCESAVLPDIQNAFARNDKWYYAAKGGNNDEGHNHNDVGSFIAYYDCEPVLVDPGCGVYTRKTFSPQRYEIWTMQSGWHNTPVINGKQQLAGKQYCADEFSYSDKNCGISFAKAYGDTECEKLTREISFGEDSLQIADTFAFNSNDNIIAEHFITPHKVEIKENCAIIDDKFLLACEEAAEISVEKQEFFGDEKLTIAWGTNAMNRIIFKTSSDENKKMEFTLRRI